MIKAYKWRVFALVAISIFMSTLDSSIVNVALPFIMRDLAETMGRIQWVVVIYLLTVSSLLLVFGRLSDIKGRPLVYKTGFTVFTLGSLCCALSPGAGWLILARAVQGTGAAMLMACSPALIVDVFEPEHRGRALGLVGACVASGLTTGPLVGGFLLEYFSWRSIFYLNLPVGAAALFYAGKVLQGRGQTAQEPLDAAGGLLMVVGIGGMILALARVPDWGLSLKFLLCLGISVAAGWAWIRHTRKAAYPLFDVELLALRAFSLPLLGALLLFAALFSLIFLMPFYLSLACGFSPARTGMIMIAPFVFLLVVSPLAGALSDRFGTRPFCVAGLACLSAGLFLLGRLTPAGGLAPLLALLALSGTGTALFISPNSTAIMGAVPGTARGIASGALATARNLGMVMGVSLSSTIFSLSFTRLTRGIHLDAFTPGMTREFLTAFSHAMTAGSVVALVGLVVTLARKP
jgi:EmrB/QacA subfamily drug resistance transporter